MKKILVLCTGNSCRSQIAEGYLKYFAGNQAMVYSAGIEAHGVNPRAIATMKDDGIDISMQTSNLARDYQTIEFDYIITVCDHAKERCPVFSSAAQQFHHQFPDPAKVTGTDEEVKRAFEQVRNRIKAYAMKFVEEHVIPALHDK